MSVPAAVRQWVESGFAAQNAGDWDGAERAYRHALALAPGQPVALQLLGLIARRRGDLPQARELMEASLRRQPAQPHVWNNLANTLEDLGDLSGALQCLDRAVALQPQYPDAHFNRARVLASMGQDAPAADALELSLQQARAAGQDPTPAQRVLQAQLLDRQGRSMDALDLLEAPQSGAPAVAARAERDATLLHNLGVLRHRHHRHEAALDALDAALAAGVDAAQAHYNRGNVLQALGRLSEAEGAYRRALERDPWHHLSLYDLARLRWRLDQADWDADLRTACERAATIKQAEAAALWALYAQLLWRAGDMEAALKAYESAAAINPSPEHLDGIARCEVRLGRFDRGLHLHEQALALTPGHPGLLASAVTSMLLTEDADEADGPPAGTTAERLHARALEACSLAPHDQYTWALISLIWRRHDPQRCRQLLDLDRLVHVLDLPAPPGFATMEAFNDALAQALSRHHHDRRAPVDQTLRGGTQTLGNLFDSAQGVIALARDHIAMAIDEVVRNLSAQPGVPELAHQLAHPLRSRLGRGWRFTDSWSSRLRAGGAHTNHVHPHGWISAVYYVEVPPACSVPGSHEGWLQLGEPDEALAAQFPPLRLIEPRPGRLVLFPSYLWHGTRPFEDQQPRTTIAFDIVPQA